MSKEQLGLDVHTDGSGRPFGLCDAGCGKPASLWYGRTSAATCGANACLKIIDTQYIEHCKEVARQIEFERELQEHCGQFDDD